MPTGITQTSLDPSDLQLSFQMAAAAGAEGIELACAHARQVRAMLTGEGARAIRQQRDAHGIATPAMSLSVLTETPALAGKSADFASAFELVGQAVAAAAGAGIDVVLLPFLGKATIELEKELDQAIEALAGLAEEAEEAGVTLAVESTLNVNQQLFLMDSLAAYGSVKLCFDTANVLARKSDPATCLRDLGAERVGLVHFHDVRTAAEGQPPEWGVGLGEGNVDFRAVAQAIDAVKYAGWSLVETAPAGPDAAKANVQKLRDLLVAGQV